MRRGKRHSQEQLFRGDTESLLFRVALNLVLSDSLGPAQKIINHFANLEDIFHAAPQELTSLGLEEERARALTSPAIFDQASRVLDWVSKKGYFLLSRDDPNYPQSLREIFDPPYLLYGAGNLEVLKEPAVALVAFPRSDIPVRGLISGP